MDNGESSYRRFLNGDDKGLEEIVRDYKDGLLFYLLGFVKDFHTAEDLMQETFFRLITRRPHFSPRYRFSTWLYTIARHAALDHLRQEGRQTVLPSEDISLDESEWQDLEETVLKEERRIQVHRAMRKLPADYQQVLWLIWFEALSPAEAAAVMKKNARQMKNLVYRAKAALRSQLEKDGFEYEGLS